MSEDYSEKKVKPSPFRRAPGYKPSPKKFAEGAARGPKLLTNAMDSISKAYEKNIAPIFMSEAEKKAAANMREEKEFLESED